MYCYHCMNQIGDGELFCPHCGGSTQIKDVPHHLIPGTVLQNKYLVGASIGEGGFGITYVGLDLNLNLKIAVKEFYPNGFANRNNKATNNITINYQNEGEYFKNGRSQFLREAQSLAKFSKEKGIVDVRDYFTENNTAYIIMEYVDGQTLSELVRKGRVFEAESIFTLMLPIMRSLEKMHSENIIHRDIAPDNIKVTEDGSLKLMDFGSARYFAGAQKKTMSVLLKPGFAPYEQYTSNGNQGPWTDVYGICATIYKCITDCIPTDSLNRARLDTLKKPSELGIRISAPLQKVLMYGLAVYPENRCPNMSKLIQLTEAALRNEMVQTDEPPVPKFDINRMKKPDDSERTTAPLHRTYGDSYNNQKPQEDLYSNKKRADRMQKNQQNGAQRKKKNAGLIAAIVIISVLIVGILAAMAAIFIINNNSKNETAASTSAETAKTTEAPKTEAPTTAKPTEKQTVTVTDVSAKKLSDAKSELEKLGLKVDTEYEESSEVAEGYVIRQSIQSGREVNKGDTIMLFVSSGKPTEPTTQAPTTLPYIDVDGEISQIRIDYYATQAYPGKKSTNGDVTHYTRNGKTTKIVCPSGMSGWNYSREYFFKNDKLYFALIYDGTEEHRLYFSDDILIRYIDNNKNTYDYGNISCPFETQAKNEAYSLL